LQVVALCLVVAARFDEGAAEEAPAPPRAAATEPSEVGAPVPTAPRRTEVAKASVLRAGPAGCDAVALTFDLCPVRDGPGFDQPLVDFLVANHVAATFFASGRWMAKHDAALRSLLGVPFFEVGTHGELHAHLHHLDIAGQRAEIAAPIERLAAGYGAHPALFRPPYGEFDDTTREVTAALDQRLVLWSVVSGDPSESSTAPRMLAALRPALRDGAIAIFHANGRGRHTLELLETLVPELRQRGLRFETVSQLLAGCAHDAAR
jgi:peptidoglycan/xylan/chitin deacetylase (PgdA/CDA1 family)